MTHAIKVIYKSRHGISDTFLQLTMPRSILAACSLGVEFLWKLSLWLGSVMGTKLMEHTHTRTHIHLHVLTWESQAVCQIAVGQNGYRALLNTLWSVVAVALSKTNKHSDLQPPRAECVWCVYVDTLPHTVFALLYSHLSICTVLTPRHVKVTACGCASVSVFSHNYRGQNDPLLPGWKEKRKRRGKIIAVHSLKKQTIPINLPPIPICRPFFLVPSCFYG